MRVAWQRYEGPTWVVAAVIYVGWISVALEHRQLTPWIAIPIAAYLTAWQSSLAHETIHAMRHVPRSLRRSLAFPPVGIWFPYELYRREHLRHHAVRDVTGPDDPESFYIDAAAWRAMPNVFQRLHRINATLAGRIFVGPALMIGSTYARELRRVRAGDRKHAGMWLRHLAAVGLLLSLLAVFAGINPLLYLALVAYPAASLGLLRSFAEHRASDDPQERTVTVVSRSALSLVFLNNNFHAAHHENPTLPWYELPASWRASEANRANPGSPILRGYRSIIRAWLLHPFDHPAAMTATHRERPRRAADARTAVSVRAE